MKSFRVYSRKDCSSPSGKTQKVVCSLLPVIFCRARRYVISSVVERSRGSEYGRSVTVLLFSIAGDFSASLTAYAVRFGRNDIKKWQYRLLKRGRGGRLRPPANLALRSYFTKKIIPRKRTVQGFPLGTSAVGGDEGLSFTLRSSYPDPSSVLPSLSLRQSTSQLATQLLHRFG